MEKTNRDWRTGLRRGDVGENHAREKATIFWNEGLFKSALKRESILDMSVD